MLQRGKPAISHCKHPRRSDLTTALEELERITRKWGMVVNYPKTESVVFGMPAATAAAATIQVGSTWMDTAMHDMGSLGRMLQIDLPRDWASLALHRDVWRGVVSRC